jgi:signal transduction histidine kinase
MFAVRRSPNARAGAEPRWSLRVDILPAVALAAFVSVTTYFALKHQPQGHRPYDVWAAALVLVAAVALVWRRHHPVAVLLVVFGATLGYFAMGYGGGPIWILLIVAYVTAAVQGHLRAAATVAIVAFLVIPWLDLLLRDGKAPSIPSLVALAAWLILLLGVAEFARVRRERAAESARIKEEEELRRASEERLRIARELHDALGHHLSLINVQSGVALHLNEQLPDQARTSLTAIRDASKEALAELRSVLDILRQDGEAAPRSPTSTLARLDELVAQSAAAGLEVRTETEGRVRPMPFGVDVAAFRIVQEALTNVARHAPGAKATVHVGYGERDLTLQVDDDGRGTSPARAMSGSGRGIVGMRERVTALGGELRTGPRTGGGFRVWARLPMDGAS